MICWGLYKRTDVRIYYGMMKNHFIEGIAVFIWKDNKNSSFWKAGKQNGFETITNVYKQKYYMKFSNLKK